jgi:hypothetical protein
MFEKLESLLLNIGELSWLKKNLNSEEKQSPLADLWWPYAAGLFFLKQEAKALPFILI